MTRPRMNLKEALDDVFDPRGKTVIDIGCGDGAIVRHLARNGANAFGVEVSDAQLARARSKAPAGNETYYVASGEHLPFADESADAVLYVNSLHHLPIQAMDKAIDEAARVLKPGGELIVIEPLAEGSYFEAMRPIEDETEVRAAAYAAIGKTLAELESLGELIYESVVRFPNAGRFIEAIVAPDPARRERLATVESELRRRFETFAQKDGEEYFLIAPMRRNRFRKIG